MYEIQDPGLLRGLRNSFGLQAPSGFTLDRIVSPVAVVRDLTSGPEEVPYALGFTNQTPDAGEHQGVLLANQILAGPPAAPDLVVRVTGLYVRSSSNSAVVVGVCRLLVLSAWGPTLSAIGPGRRQDRGGEGRSRAVVYQTPDAAFIPTSHRIRVVQVRADEGAEIPLPEILLPRGHVIAVRPQTPDVGLMASFSWTEFRP